MITYRWIDGWNESARPDWERISEIAERRGWPLMDPNTTRVLLAEDGDALVGFHCLRLVLHVEPLFVEPEMRGTEVADTLASKMQEFVEREINVPYLAIAEHPSAAQICEAHGMTRVDKPVYVGGV